MLLTVMQALGELAVLYPVNGAFYQYMVRFIDPSWYVPTFARDSPQIEDAHRTLGALLLAGTTPSRG
jgi:hypothetical protein